MNISNKTIIVTGASDGIGKEIALRLAKEGSKLALIARNQTKLDAVATQAKELGATQVATYSCDVCDTKKMETTIQNIIETFGGIDILINNAGIWQKLSPLQEISSDTITDVINTNLTALIQTTRLCLPALHQATDEAAIINISSKAGVVAQKGLSVYNASKFGVQGFTEALKIDLKETDIRVAGVYQAGINTGMFATKGEEVPLHKFSEPEDLADIITYMLMQPAKIWLHEIKVEF